MNKLIAEYPDRIDSLDMWGKKVIYNACAYAGYAKKKKLTEESIRNSVSFRIEHIDVAIDLTKIRQYMLNTLHTLKFLSNTKWIDVSTISTEAEDVFAQALQFLLTIDDYQEHIERRLYNFSPNDALINFMENEEGTEVEKYVGNVYLTGIFCALICLSLKLLKFTARKTCDSRTIRFAATILFPNPMLKSLILAGDKNILMTDEQLHELMTEYGKCKVTKEASGYLSGILQQVMSPEWINVRNEVSALCNIDLEQEYDHYYTSIYEAVESKMGKEIGPFNAILHHPEYQGYFD